jgi:signal transduction histidine kinase
MTAVTRFFDSMTGRIFLVLLVGVALSAGVAWTLADAKRQADLRRIDLERTAERVQEAVARWDAAVTPEARAQLAARGAFGVRLARADAVPIADEPTLTGLLQARLPGRGIAAQSTDARACRPPGAARQDGRSERRGVPPCWLVTAAAPTPLKLVFETPPRPTGSPLVFEPLYIAVLFLAAALLSLLVARIAAGPLATLSMAASELGRNLQRAPITPAGPIEVRRAAEAFNVMQAQLQKQMAERMHMLAAITHDLQTPVTRLRLRLERVQDHQLRERLLGDLGAMQTLIREGLDLARSADRVDTGERVDLRSLLESIVEDEAEAGHDVEVTSAVEVDVQARPDALRRIVLNLIENALKYGGAARVSAAVEDGAPVIRIRDHGEGLPEEELETVFSPFVRLEDSRSRETGGAGLGLTIARTLAEREGATVSLRNHPEGGAEAIVRFAAAA